MSEGTANISTRKTLCKIKGSRKNTWLQKLIIEHKILKHSKVQPFISTTLQLYVNKYRNKEITYSGDIAAEFFSPNVFKFTQSSIFVPWPWLNMGISFNECLSSILNTVFCSEKSEKFCLCLNKLLLCTSLVRNVNK